MHGTRKHFERIFDPARNPEVHGVPYACGADTAYPIAPWLQKGFQGVMVQLAAQADYNRQFASCRESVEWGFGKVYALWPYLGFEKLQKSNLAPTEEDFMVGVWLTNLHTCAYGSTTSSYFNCYPPTLEEYLDTF